MLGIMLQKMWHKRWMNFSLLLGCVLLVGTVVSFPLYQKAAYDRMLQDEFRNYVSSEGEFPTVIHMKNVSKNEKNGATITKLEAFQEEIPATLNVTLKENIRYYSLINAVVKSDMNRVEMDDTHISLGMMTNLPDHVDMISGEMYSDKGITDDGIIEVIVSQESLVKLGLLVGETLTFKALDDYLGNPIRILVKGVFVPNDSDPDYWQSKDLDTSLVCYMNEDVFREYFTGERAGKYMITCHYYSLFEYEDMIADDTPYLVENTKYLLETSKYRSVVDEPRYYNLLVEFSKKINRISATLIIMQVPVLIMLAAFLFMISGQMYEMEKNEISVIKSRGSSRGQIFRLYLYQGILLTIVGGALGVLLGGVFARVLGSVRNFLEFDTQRSLTITYTQKSTIYALAAMLITLCSITLPAIGHSKVTIVNLKQSKNVRKKAWWQRFFIDILLLGISGYGYYSFHKNMTNVSGSVLSGQALDPLLYVSSSLFIVGMGLLFIRLQPYIVNLIYIIGKKFWHPASYISFMETIKQSGKQQLIMLFLIMTVSLGMYHSTVARTILENAVNNTDYNDACDMILAEKWVAKVDQEGTKTGEYEEPDYKKFASMDFAEKYTKVYLDKQGYVSESKNDNQIVTIMGIHTRDFGSMTYVDKSILSKHYYEYLNDLAKDPKGVLLSDNFRTKLGYKVGDTITVYNMLKTPAACNVVGFVEYFPGYAPTVTDLNPDGTSFTADNYLVVMHYDNSKKVFGTLPYEVWVDLKDDADPVDIYDWIEEHDIRVKRYVNRASDVEKTMEDPLLQGTNGVLTLGFVVTIILCAVGYLIYWIMSIKDRELIFGVLRAGGFHKGEIFHMLLVEQLFTGVFAVLAGIGIGLISSYMFVPIIQTSFASATQVLPLRLIIDGLDLARLYGVIALVMLTCLTVLVTILFHMNVTKALKLGEE